MAHQWRQRRGPEAEAAYGAVLEICPGRWRWNNATAEANHAPREAAWRLMAGDLTPAMAAAQSCYAIRRRPGDRGGSRQSETGHAKGGSTVLSRQKNKAVRGGSKAGLGGSTAMWLAAQRCPGEPSV